MPCYYPIPAFHVPGGVDPDTGRGERGKVVFSESKKHGSTLRPIEVPCGQCIGCRLERSRQWAMRCVHEASLHDRNMFITLTYSDTHLPQRSSLHYKDFQTFMKRYRRFLSPRSCSYFVCGEYGDLNGRPHYHAIIFGHQFEDQLPLLLLGDHKLKRSPTLEKLWFKGSSSIGEVNFQTAAYVAQYCLKKRTGPHAAEHYTRYDLSGIEYTIEPEFARMSLNPAIGKRWLEKWHTDVYPHDYVIVNGNKVKPPKFYDKLLDEADPDTLAYVKYMREVEAATHAADNATERLEVRATVAKGLQAHYNRRNKI